VGMVFIHLISGKVWCQSLNNLTLRNSLGITLRQNVRTV